MDGGSELRVGHGGPYNYSKTPIFYASSLEEVYIGRSLTYESSNYAPFRDQSNLTLVTFGNSVTSIGSHTFDGCSGLTEITIPNSVESIGEFAFHYCDGLTEITFGNSVTSIGSGAFDGCSGLTEITILNSVISIGSGAFDNCSSLKKVILEDGDSKLRVGYGDIYSKGKNLSSIRHHSRKYISVEA